MLEHKKRLHFAVFTGRPLKRTRFMFGSASFFLTESPQGAIVVSKKGASRAVDRNRIRRRLSPLLRELLKKSKHSIVLYPTKDVLRAPVAALRDSLEQLV